MDTIVAITGHRPEQLGDIAWVENVLTQTLQQLNPSHLIQGMAAGADLLSAVVSRNLKIPYTAAKPWAGHYPRNEDKTLYEGILRDAEKVVNVNAATTYPGPYAYHARNEYMVDNATIVVAIWNGGSKGGTAACVRYAKKLGRTIIHINPDNQTITTINDSSLF